jgi:hypothetical protein
MNKHIYTSDRENRFVLGTCGSNPLVFIGINPSKATPEEYDNTIKRIESISKSRKYDSWIMLNIYPKIETNPSELPRQCNADVHKENIKHIKKHINDDTVLIAAWGNLIEKRAYLKKCLREIINEINGLNKKWYTTRELTKKGNPRHPLWLRIDDKLKEFDIKRYMDEL